MVAVARAVPVVEEERFLLTGVSWEHFVALVRMFERDGINTRLTYREGDLELMSPGPLHEATKTLIARLIEAYAEERDINLNGFGETLFKSRAVERGAQADECYVIGRLGKTPQLVIEVVYSRPKVDKLDVYRGLEVPEVWFYRNDTISMHVLENGRFVKRARSKMLPELDLEQLLEFVKPGEDQTPLVRAYRRALKRAR
jgi:Uma2 family endonuclease